MALPKFSRCLLLIWSILVIFADFVRCSDPQATKCEMPSVVTGHKAELTCDFGVNMQDEGQRKEIFIERQTSPGETEYIAVCDVNGYPDYKCKPLSGLTRLDFSNVTRYLTVGLSSVSEKDEGEYICQVTDPHWPVTKTCHFSLKNTQVATCDMPSVVKGETAELTCDFKVNMQDEGQRKEVFIQRQISSREAEYIAVCDVNGHPDYKCNQTLPDQHTRMDFSNVTRYLTVSLSSVSEEDEGEYVCRVTDPDWPVAKTCHFSLERALVPSATTAHEGTSTTVIVVLIVFICVVAMVLGFVIFYFRRRVKSLKNTTEGMKESLETTKKMVKEGLAYIDGLLGKGATTEGSAGESCVVDTDKDESLQPLTSGGV
ncbi:uncharacterized protein LOC143291620 isoform X2 [Babylonia areolata]|uniref:uncharacterized protein LOC143291620 isoform X2 n=1 Tax=Babylonia areolata TaxID=304850 RepID=UPI003FD3C712